MLLWTCISTVRGLMNKVLTDLPAGVSLGYQLHDVEFAAGEACGHAAWVRVAAWRVAELA